MAKKKFEQALESLEDLRRSPGDAATLERLRKALANRNNYLVAKAARIAGELGLRALIPDLLSAFDRFFIDPVKSDPQCWAKNALVQAFGGLEHNDSAVFLRGLRHVQLEPVWGGQEDTAAALRGNSALALVQCRDLSDIQALTYLLEALVDRDKNVRVEAARSIGRMNRPEAALLLRLRALVGDEEPAALGACLSALLSIEGPDGIDFVSRFLDSEEDTREEAALALGVMKSPEALKILKQRWERERNSSFAGVLLSAIALTRQQEAVDFLVNLIESNSPSATASIAALGSAGFPPEVRSQVHAAVERSQNALLWPTFDKHFPR